MAWMQLQQRTIVVNHISKVASDAAAPYKILACPVRHPSGTRHGRARPVQSAERAGLRLHQTRIAEVLAKRATSIIQAQYDQSTGLMTRQAFERQATALLVDAAYSAASAHHSLSRHRPPARHQRDLRHARGRRCDRQRGRMHGQDVAARRTVGAHFRRSAGRAHPNSSMDAARASPRRYAPPPPPSCRAPGRVRSKCPLSRRRAHRPLRQSARACAGDGGDRLQGGQGSRPQSGGNVPGFRSEHHPAAHRHFGHRQAARCLEQRQFPSGCAAHTAAARQLRTSALRIVDPHAGRPRRDHSAGQILSAAERYQLMPTVDRWVVRHACELLGEHSALGGRRFARFAINLSGQSLQDDSFLEFVVEQIKTSGCRPACCVSS
jgi:hypothetical protein